MQRETTEEDGEHEDPFQVEQEGVNETHGADTVAHECEGDVTEAIEDDDDGEPDFPTIMVC